MLKPTTANTCGTSLQGYVTCSYDHLVKCFGEPSGGFDNKTDVEWILQDGRTGAIVAIYNWKNGPNYGCGPVEKITSWNIGGASQAVLPLVQGAVAAPVSGWRTQFAY